jgi:hypothetical protein
MRSVYRVLSLARARERMEKMPLQSRLCKSLSAVVVCVGLLVVSLLYLSSWFSATPASQKSTPVRARPLDVPSAVGTGVKLGELPTLGRPSGQEKKSNEAYVALQYGRFFLALRVLGQSLKESSTDRDMVALCMPDVQEYQRDILTKDGWIVRSLNALPKSCVGDHMYSRHFTKVQAWLLTEYRRVVLIDSDAIVLRNIDELFSCGEFCAAYRHSDLFNTGVVVLKPSEETFRNICSKIQSIRSFTNGDQGFLNYFYEDLKKASMFSRSDSLVVNGNQQFQRLPSEYNGDVSVFYLTNKWMYLDTEEPYVLHYTLGPVKPWKWWSYPLFSLNWRWKSLRDRLDPKLNEPSLWDWKSWLPLALLLAIWLSSKIWFRYYTNFVAKNSFVRGLSCTINPVGHYTLKIVLTLFMLLALYWAFFCVPETMNPIEAWIRYGLWTLLFFSIPFSLYCHLAYVVGTQSAGINAPPKNTPVVRSWRIASEALLWLATSGIIFYLQFWVPVAQSTMKRRALAFVGLGFLNLVLCYWCGRRVARFCHNLGLSHSASL